MSAQLVQSKEEYLWEQYEDRKQQDESYLVGMWTFLATEIMFFGTLFISYAVYRYKYPEAFYAGHEYMNVALGTINTAVLLTSSLTMALAVYFAQKRKRWMQIGMLVITMFLAFGFLGIKFVEYGDKFREHLVPGYNFEWNQADVNRLEASTAPMNIIPSLKAGSLPADAAISHDAQMYFIIYFAMTGLHAIHVIIGILIMMVFIGMLMANHPSVRYHMPMEMLGLYWHFVDIVWIFLYPLLYLIPR
jgi:cytochrome c oxidase subunit 3